MDYAIREIEARDNQAVEHVIRTCLIEFGGNREGMAWCDPDLGRFSEVYNREGFRYWVVVQKMYCLPEARGTGIAHRLMERALAYAGQYYQRCYIETLHNMTAANRFYRKYGFTPLDAPLLDTGHFSCDVWYIKEL